MTKQYVEVGKLIQIDDGIDGEPGTIFAAWNKKRSTLPADTKLYALVASDEPPAEPKCPCGTAYLRVEGGYVPVCDCAAKNSVAVNRGDVG